MLFVNEKLQTITYMLYISEFESNICINGYGVAFSGGVYHYTLPHVYQLPLDWNANVVYHNSFDKKVYRNSQDNAFFLVMFCIFLLSYLNMNASLQKKTQRIIWYCVRNINNIVRIKTDLIIKVIRIVLEQSMMVWYCIESWAFIYLTIMRK